MNPYMNNQTARINMIKQQLRTGDVLNEAILDLYEEIPRNEFVPFNYKDFAFSDMQIPLPHGQRMMTPLEEGLLLQALNLTGKETVLEIGTGTGFLTALLSKLAKKVISIDYFADFTSSASQRLNLHHCHNVELITGDGSLGWLDKAPYDIMVFTGALNKMNDTHKLQLLPGGKIFAIIGHNPIMKGQLLSFSPQEEWIVTEIFETNIPPLIDKLKPIEFVF